MLRKLLGNRGERQAEQFLRKLGYRIIERNYSCPGGELDLVATDEDTLVFVEVKTLSDDESRHPEEAVNRTKRQRLTRAANHFLACRTTDSPHCRFDIVAIILPEKGKAKIEHFIDAFPPER